MTATVAARARSSSGRSHGNNTHAAPITRMPGDKLSINTDTARNSFLEGHAAGASDIALARFGKFGNRNCDPIWLLGQRRRLYGQVRSCGANAGQPHDLAFVGFAFAAEAKARRVTDAQMIVGRLSHGRGDNQA